MILYNQTKQKPGCAGKICMEDRVLITSLIVDKFKMGDRGQKIITKVKIKQLN